MLDAEPNSLRTTGMDASTTSEAAVSADLRHVVHPFSPLLGRTAADLTIVDRADGLRFWTVDGREFLDAKSGLINVNVGWGREELARVAAESIARVGYATMFFDHGHVAGALLAEKLAQITPSEIDRFLFTIGGSDANETALKFARMYQAGRGHADKNVFIARERSYHGMSMGGTSLSGSPAYWNGVGPMLPGVVHIPQPDPTDAGAASDLEEAIAKIGPRNVAAFIAEPVSNPAGVNVPHRAYWPAVREICDRHDVLLIADEVITGFGRTGRMFACEHWGLVPDMVSMSKGLTSGYQPLGAVGITSAIVETIGDREEPLLHGFTAGGHPAACAVALANIAIIEDEQLVANSERMGARLRSHLQGMSAEHGLGAVRGLGLLCALDVGSDRTSAVPAGSSDTLGQRIETALKERGMLIRRYADTIILAPALVATEADIDEIAERLADAVRAALRE